MKKILNYIFKKFFFRGWEYQLKSTSKTYDFVFDKLSNHEKLIRWLKISDYLKENYESGKVRLINYPKNISDKIVSKLNLTIEELHLMMFIAVEQYN